MVPRRVFEMVVWSARIPLDEMSRGNGQGYMKEYLD